MSRGFLLIATLIASLAVFGQQTTTTTAPGTWVSGTGLIVQGGTATTGYVAGVPANVPLLSTPTATFAAPPSRAGISDAGVAGISHGTPYTGGVASTLGSSTMVISYPGTVANVAPVIPAQAETAPPAEASGRAINDMGPSYYSDAVPVSGPTESLGKIAAAYKARRGTLNVRMYTNADILRLPNNVSQGIELPNRSLPASDQPMTAPQESAPAAPRPPRQQSNLIPNAPSGTQIAMNTGKPSPGYSEEGQAQPQTQMQAQPAPEKQKAESSQPERTLPRSASPLPFLIVVALITTIAGLLLHKLRS